MSRTQATPRVVLTLLMVILGTSPTHGDVLALYAFNGSRNSTDTHATTDSGPMQFGTGLSNYSLANTLSIPANATTNSESGAFNGNDYFEFNFNTNGLEIKFTQLSVKLQTPKDKKTVLLVQTSFEPWGNGNGPIGYFSAGSLTSLKQFTADLTAFAYLQRVTKEVTFRFYVHESTANDSGSHQFDDITFTGEVIPEPASLAIAGVLALAGLRRPVRA